MLSICEVSPDTVPMEILLLADPSRGRIRSYLEACRIFVADTHQAPAGIIALRPKDALHVEIMNLAVVPMFQRQGIGTALIHHAISWARDLGAKQLLVGTGNSSLGQLAFYQRLGFRISGVQQDYFRDDDLPIYENGIRCIDMIELTQEL